jgi:hypothetical protein
VASIFKWWLIPDCGVSKIRHSSRTPNDSALSARRMSRRSPSAVALQNASSDGLSVVELTIGSVVELGVGLGLDNGIVDAVKSISISNNIDIVAGY